MQNNYLSDQQVADYLGVHRVTIWRWVRECGFPEPIRLTRGSTRWRRAEVEAWIEDRCGHHTGASRGVSLKRTNSQSVDCSHAAGTAQRPCRSCSDQYVSESIWRQASHLYPCGVDDFGDFRPSSTTPQQVCDVNTAFYLFRIKAPFIESEFSCSTKIAKDLVYRWLRTTWGRESGKRDRIAPRGEVLQTLVNAIVGTEVPVIGKNLTALQVAPDVQARQQSDAPEWLILLDQVAQRRAERDRDFSSRTNLFITCGHGASCGSKRDDERVKPVRFVEAMNHVTRPR